MLFRVFTCRFYAKMPTTTVLCWKIPPSLSSHFSSDALFFYEKMKLRNKKKKISIRTWTAYQACGIRNQSHQRETSFSVWWQSFTLRWNVFFEWNRHSWLSQLFSSITFPNKSLLYEEAIINKAAHLAGQGFFSSYRSSKQGEVLIIERKNEAGAHEDTQFPVTV